MQQHRRSSPRTTTDDNPWILHKDQQQYFSNLKKYNKTQFIRFQRAQVYIRFFLFWICVRAHSASHHSELITSGTIHTIEFCSCLIYSK